MAATPLTVYPNMAAASTTVATANVLYGNPPIAAGIAAKTQLVGTATGFGEFWSQGNAGAWAAGALNLSIAPTGHGWFLDAPTLNDRTLLGGLYTAQARGACNANTATVDLYYRLFVYDPVALTYTLIGILSQLGNSYTTAVTNFAFAAQFVPPVALRPGQRLYIDLWGNITASTMVSGNTLSCVQSNVGGSGSNAIFIATAGYIGAFVPRYVPRGLLGTIIQETVSQPLPYVDRGILSTVVYENRTFIPRALSGVYIPDDPSLLWVPRGFLSTIQIATGLIGTLPGVGTLTGTLSLSTALSTTLAGVGTLTGTLSANMALSTEFDGVGTLAPAMQSLSLPLPYVPRSLGATIIYENRTFIPRAITGTYIPDTQLPVPRAILSTIYATVGLGGTLAGVGTLSGTLSATTALTTTFAGVGTLSATLSANTALATTLVGVGTFAATLSANTALSVTVIGVGTFAGTLSASVALSLTFAGVGTLTGTLSFPVALLFLSATWITRDLQVTWKTRDESAAWTTRDDKAAFTTRDDKAAWNTRDDLATWKARS